MKIDPSAKQALQSKSPGELMRMLQDAMKNPQFVAQVNKMGLANAANAMQNAKPEDIEKIINSGDLSSGNKSGSGHGSK